MGKCIQYSIAIKCNGYENRGQKFDLLCAKVLIFPQCMVLSGRLVKYPLELNFIRFDHSFRTRWSPCDRHPKEGDMKTIRLSYRQQARVQLRSHSRLRVSRMMAMIAMFLVAVPMLVQAGSTAGAQDARTPVQLGLSGVIYRQWQAS